MKYLKFSISLLFFFMATLDLSAAAVRRLYSRALALGPRMAAIGMRCMHTGAGMDEVECCGNIESIQDAMDIMEQLTEDSKKIQIPPQKGTSIPFHNPFELAPKYSSQTPFPWGIWFRGVSDKKFRLEPSAYRLTSRSNRKYMLDEATAIKRYRSYDPSVVVDGHSAEAQLAIMQHHGLPTRLLDWSESIDVALYFATLGADKMDDPQIGRLYILNAMRLNKTSLPMQTLGIGEYNSLPVRLRTAMAESHSIPQLAKDMELGCVLATHDERKKFVEEHRLAYPIAFEPQRIDRRLVAQSGCFTIAGGVAAFSSRDRRAAFPIEMSIERVNAEAIASGEPPIVQCWDITNPARIARLLRNRRINAATLMGDQDNKAKVVVDEWTLPIDMDLGGKDSRGRE